MIHCNIFHIKRNKCHLTLTLIETGIATLLPHSTMRKIHKNHYIFSSYDTFDT